MTANWFRVNDLVELDVPKGSLAPLPLERRGVITAREPQWTGSGETAADPATARYTVRLLDGTDLTEVPPERLTRSRVDYSADFPPRERLYQRGYRLPVYLTADAAVTAVTMAIYYHPRDPERYPVAPVPEDDLDALLCAVEARSDLARRERDLIGRLRERNVSWEAIGLLLGYPLERAARSAAAHHATLKKRTGSA